VEDNEEKKIPVIGEKITIKRPKTKKPKEEMGEGFI